MNEDSKLIDLETRIAFQDDTIQQLNDCIYQQQKSIDRLDKILHALLDQVQEVMHDTAQKPGHEKPPHY